MCHDSDSVTDYISINLLILKSNWKIKSNCGHPNQSYSAVLSFGAILMFIVRSSHLYVSGCKPKAWILK